MEDFPIQSLGGVLEEIYAEHIKNPPVKYNRWWYVRQLSNLFLHTTIACLSHQEHIVEQAASPHNPHPSTVKKGLMFFSIVSSLGVVFFLVFPWSAGSLIISLKFDISRERSFRNTLPLPSFLRIWR